MQKQFVERDITNKAWKELSSIGEIQKEFSIPSKFMVMPILPYSEECAARNSRVSECWEFLHSPFIDVTPTFSFQRDTHQRHVEGNTATVTSTANKGSHQ